MLAIILVSLLAGLIVIFPVVKKYTIPWIQRFKKPVDLPVLNLQGWRFSQAEKDFLQRAPELLAQGYETGEPFLLWTSTGYELILAPEYMFELRNVPETDLPPCQSWEEPAVEIPFEYGTELVTFGLGVKVMKRFMNANLDQVLPSVMEEATRAVSGIVPPSPEWAEFCPWEVLNGVANAMMQQVWFGPELSRDKQWHECSVQGEHDFYTIASELTKWPLILKPLAALFSSRGNLYRDNLRKADTFVRPRLTQCRQRLESVGDSSKDASQNHFIAWTAQAAAHEGVSQTTLERQSEIIMTVFFDAVFALRSQLSMILFDLAAHPEVLTPLRRELEQKLDVFAGPVTSRTLGTLTKLDSVMKESLRMNPPAHLSGERATRKPLSLSNGLVIPTGVKLGYTASVRNKDPAYWGPQSTEFDAFRFESMRQRGAKENMDYAFTGSTLDMSTFGKGLLHCPARYLMEYTIKIGLIALITEYDFLLVQGQTVRPKNGSWGVTVNVPTCNVRLRHR